MPPAPGRPDRRASVPLKRRTASGVTSPQPPGGSTASLTQRTSATRASCSGGNPAKSSLRPIGSVTRFTDELAKIDARAAVDDFGEHPVRRGWVVLIASPGFPVQPPAPEGFEKRLAVAPEFRAQGSVRKAARVQQDLLYAHDFLSVRPEFRDDFGHPFVELQQPFFEKEPNSDADHRLRRRKDAVERLVRCRTPFASLNRGAERPHSGQLSVPGDGHLGTRKYTVIQVPSRPREDCFEPFAIDADIFGFGRDQFGI